MTTCPPPARRRATSRSVNFQLFRFAAAAGRCPCRYVAWLEANGLSDSVPRMEAHYLNPSPWAEKERYEIEFNDIQREVKELIWQGVDSLTYSIIAIALAQSRWLL